MTRTTWVRLAALMFCLMLLASACSGGDESSDGAADSLSDSSGGSGSSGGDLGNSAQALLDADCREYVTAFGGLNPSVADPDEIRTMHDVADFLEQVAEEVPNEISDDFKVVAGAYRTFAGAMGDLDFTDPTAVMNMTPEDAQALEAASAQLDTAEFEQAAQNIEAFLTENCAVE